MAMRYIAQGQGYDRHLDSLFTLTQLLHCAKTKNRFWVMITVRWKVEGHGKSSWQGLVSQKRHCNANSSSRRVKFNSICGTSAFQLRQ